MWRLRSALGNGIWYCELRLLWSVLMTQFWVSWNQWRLSAGASAWAWSTPFTPTPGIPPPCTSPGWWYSLFEAWWRGNTLQLRNKNKTQQLFSWREKWNKSKKMFQWRIQFALLHCFWFWFATQWKTASTISWSFHWFHCLLQCTSWFSMSFSFALPLMFRSFWLWMTPKLLCLSLFWLLSLLWWLLWLLFSHQKPDFKQQFDVKF